MRLGRANDGLDPASTGGPDPEVKVYGYTGSQRSRHGLHGDTCDRNKHHTAMAQVGLVFNRTWRAGAILDHGLLRRTRDAPAAFTATPPGFAGGLRLGSIPDCDASELSS